MEKGCVGGSGTNTDNSNNNSDNDSRIQGKIF